jgi:hypothetical protein
MAAAMTSVTLAADAWTSILAAAGTATIGLQNAAGHVVLIRIDASAASGDAATAPADSLAPGEYRTYPLLNGDKVFGRPTTAGIPATVTLRQP